MFSAIIISHLFHVIFCSQSQKASGFVWCTIEPFSSITAPHSCRTACSGNFVTLCQIKSLSICAHLSLYLYIQCVFNQHKAISQCLKCPAGSFRQEAWHSWKVLVNPDVSPVSGWPADPGWGSGCSWCHIHQLEDSDLQTLWCWRYTSCKQLLWFNCTLYITGSQSIVQYGSVLGGNQM